MASIFVPSIHFVSSLNATGKSLTSNVSALYRSHPNVLTTPVTGSLLFPMMYQCQFCTGSVSLSSGRLSFSVHTTFRFTPPGDCTNLPTGYSVVPFSSTVNWNGRTFCMLRSGLNCSGRTSCWSLNGRNRGRKKPFPGGYTSMFVSEPSCVTNFSKKSSFTSSNESAATKRRHAFWYVMSGSWNASTDFCTRKGMRKVMLKSLAKPASFGYSSLSTAVNVVNRIRHMCQGGTAFTSGALILTLTW
mmetsp:Transcript_12572/g.30595  ORF Transcript_12572/g.30595 Transcript_12572/m.30595 type:complete len:245 (-) Transcript_12572:2789-3523(-)